MNKPNFIYSILGLILSIYVFLTASSFPTPPGNTIGPGYYPMLLSIGLLVMSSVLLIQTLLRVGKEEFEKFNIKSSEVIRFAVSFIATVIYAIAMQFLGFILASVLYLFFLMYLLKNREYIKMSIISVGVSVSVYLIFSNVLNLTLPLGFFS